MEAIYTLTEQQVWAIAGAAFMMLFDLVSGFAVAVINKEVSSSKMREGLAHKMVLLLFIALSLAVEVLSLHVADFGFCGVTVYAVCVFIIVMEVSSILENLCRAYPELRDTKLMRIFENEKTQEKGE